MLITPPDSISAATDGGEAQDETGRAEDEHPVAAVKLGGLRLQQRANRGTDESWAAGTHLRNRTRGCWLTRNVKIRFLRHPVQAVYNFFQCYLELFHT